MAEPLGREGIKGLPLMEKKRKNVPTAIKLEGGGGVRPLMERPLKNIFFTASLTHEGGSTLEPSDKKSFITI